MFKRVFGVMGKLINKQEFDPSPVSVAAEDGQQSCQLSQHDPQDLVEIERLKSELVALELELGRLLVSNARLAEKHRYKTIVKLHLLTAKTKTHQKWVLESNCLIRFFNSKKENDSEVATEMLLPISLKYRNARAVA